MVGTSRSRFASFPSRAAFRVFWPLGVAIAIVYAAGSWVAYEFFHASSAGAVLFPPAGVSFAALVVSPRSRWPGVLCVIASAEFLVDLAQGQRLRLVLGFVLANTAEPFFGALLFRRHFDAHLVRRRDLLGFICTGAVAGPFVGALIGGTTISVGFHQGWVGAFLPFWSGDGLGVLTVGGAVLAWRAHAPQNLRKMIPLYACVVASTVAATIVGFWPSSVPFVYLPMPVLFLIAFRYGPAVVSVAGLAMSLTANVMSAAGHGPWGVVGPTARLGISTLQAFLAIALVAAWLLCVEVAEQQAARYAIQIESAARRKAETLQRVTANLATATTTAEICRVVVEDAVRLIADRGVVGVVTRNGLEMLTLASTDFPNEVASKYQRLPVTAATHITQAARLGRIEVAETLDDLVRDFPETIDSYSATGTRCCLSVPARSGNRIVGALAFGFDREHSCDTETVGFAQMLGDLFGQAIDRTQQYEREYETAHQLQRSLLPLIAPHMMGVRIATRYQPAERRHEIGGDWYDMFELPRGRVGFAVGDVVGHDLEAAVAMSRLQTALRVVALTAPGPSAVLEHLSGVSSSIPGAPMTTVSYGEYDPVSRHLRYASAGHMPFLLRTESSTAYLWGGRSAPLGVDSKVRHESEINVPIDSVLLGFTDGLVERSGESVTDGLERLADVVGVLETESVDAFCDSLLDAMVLTEARDDTAILVLRFE
jgi:integral membrane sensor domain MASE1